jgi:hypothetical protein
MGTILNDVKHQLGILPEDDSFDDIIKIHINSVMLILTQLGVGPAEGFMLVDGSEEWDQLFTDQRLNAVKSYLYLRVKILMDPPATGFTQDSYDRQIQEMEFRLNSEVDF